MEKEQNFMEHAQKSITVTEISPLGYGNAESSISYSKQIESGKLSAEVAARAVEMITSGECLKPVDNDDDGCIDGRPAETVLYVNQSGKFYESPADNANHERAKVAGGGYITSLAIQLGTGSQGRSLDEDVATIAASLAENGVYCGAHTGAHASGEATDCGANDKVKPILENGMRYKEQIAATTDALLAVADMKFDRDIYDGVLNNWQTATNTPGYFAASTGSSRLETIERVIAHAQAELDSPEPLAVIKGLGGDHKEDFIVINYRDKETFSQARFGARLASEFPDIEAQNRAQSFVVDVPRVVELAHACAGDDKDRLIAGIYAGVLYQLATAATLTDGSLRTFIVS